MLRTSTIAVLGLLLTACSNEAVVEQVAVSAEPLQASAAQIEYAEFAEPSDIYLAEIYNRSCTSCHSVDGAGAPLTGHSEEWNRRLTLRGERGLLASTLKGSEGMPAMGMCADCSEDDFQSLINFMMAEQ